MTTSTPRCPLLGGVGWWLRQFSDTGEGTLPAIAQTMRDVGGGTCWMQKVMDGLDWQGEAAIDPSTPITSVATLTAFAQQTKSLGLPLIPIVVPRGANPQAEGQEHGAIAKAVGCLCVDLEPYSGFYDKSPLSTIPQYLSALRAAAGNAYLILQHDPRPYGSSGIGMPGAASSFDAICAQHYVGWSSIGWTNVQQEIASFQALASLGKDLYATVWALGDLSLMSQFWNAILPNCLGFSVFAFGYANETDLQTIAALPKPHIPTPDPNPSLVAALKQIATIADAAVKGTASGANSPNSSVQEQRLLPSVNGQLGIVAEHHHSPERRERPDDIIVVDSGNNEQPKPQGPGVQ